MAFRWLKETVAWLSLPLFSGMEQSGWADLPDIVVIEIYKSLNDRDRAHMALACKNWSRLFVTPILWRTKHFDLGGYRAHAAGIRATKFANHLGHYIKYLSISCSHPSYNTCKFFQRSVEDFFSKMRQTQLHEFELVRLELDRFWKYDSTREKITSIFSNFFKIQKTLRSFDMAAAQFTVNSGCRVLDAIAQSSDKTIKELCIEDFFNSRSAVYQAPRFKSAIVKFSNLVFLGLNYNYLSEDIVEMLAANINGTLDAMNIKVYRNDPHFHRISGFAWKSLARKCPKLKVTVWFEGMGFASEIIPVLVNEIPVSEIHLWTGYDEDEEWRLSAIIEHISKCYYKTLESISLELDNNHELVDESVLAMVNKCKTLREIVLNAVIAVDTVEVICHQQLEKKNNLKLFHATVCGLTEEEWVNLCVIRDLFAPMVKERDLDFRFSSDLLIDVLPS